MGRLPINCGNCKNGEDYKGKTYCNEHKKSYESNDKGCNKYEEYEGKYRG